MRISNSPTCPVADSLSLERRHLDIFVKPYIFQLMQGKNFIQKYGTGNKKPAP